MTEREQVNTSPDRSIHCRGYSRSRTGHFYEVGDRRPAECGHVLHSTRYSNNYPSQIVTDLFVRCSAATGGSGRCPGHFGKNIEPLNWLVNPPFDHQTIAVQTFISIWWLKPPAIITASISVFVQWLFIILFVAIGFGGHTSPPSTYYATPTPVRCFPMICISNLRLI